jgi:hypothetical protein
VNPEYFLFDSDVLIQIARTDLLVLIEFLRERYSIRSAITGTVRWEISKRRDQVLEKAIKKGVISALEPAETRRLLFRGVNSNEEGESRIARQSQLQRQMLDRVDEGEADTHSLAVVSALPVVSNDERALRALAGARLPLPQYTLRLVDLMVLCYQADGVTEAQCQKAISKLRSARTEAIDRTMVSLGFKASLVPDMAQGRFEPRVLDRDQPTLGNDLTPLPWCLNRLLVVPIY